MDEGQGGLSSGGSALSGSGDFGAFSNNGGVSNQQQPVAGGQIQQQPIMSGSFQQQPIASGPIRQQYIASVPTIASGGGDVVLSNGKQRKNWKKWVIGGVVGMAAVGVLTFGIIYILNIGHNKSTVRKKFDELANYVINGDEEGDSVSNIIYAISVSEEDLIDIQRYYEGLNQKKEEFFNVASGVISEGILKNYAVDLNILENVISYRDTTRAIKKIYDDEGFYGARMYVNENVLCSVDDTDFIKYVCEAENEYYNALLQDLDTDYADDVSQDFLYKMNGDFARTVLNIEIKRVQNVILGELNNG